MGATHTILIYHLVHIIQIGTRQIYLLGHGVQNKVILVCVSVVVILMVTVVMEMMHVVMDHMIVQNMMVRMHTVICMILMGVGIYLHAVTQQIGQPMASVSV